MIYKFNDSELTSEKSLWDVYILSRRILPSKIHLLIVLIVSFLLALNAFAFEKNIGIILSDVRLWAKMGFSFSITTLGFLIAGFTIFATLAKPKMMLAMMDHTHKETGLPTLKYNFFAFMNVFIAYISLSVVYLCVVIFGQKGGMLSNVIEVIPYSECLKISLIKISYVFIGSSFIYLLLLLKSYIFNIYTIVMNFLRWEYHQD